MQGNDSEVMCEMTGSLQSIIATYFTLDELKKRKERNGFERSICIKQLQNTHFQIIFPRLPFL